MSGGIQNEEGVWYMYGNALIDMLCRAFNFIAEVEEPINEDEEYMTVTSDKSKPDYVCWKLMYRQVDHKEMHTAAVVVETKHL